ncbi:hypothetical protein Bca52824_026440 [Brassica carinata]|uniref:F-box domain-containing protein n=1 Tax=Brassica carinata TaxID=52824 RepID=A0A8X7V931_BRACI|nr:hypothetical protein Bca52824_026440 [Brassica carinata]
MEWRKLPTDLVEEILSRIPAITLARFRSTSKQWSAILKSSSFAKMHTAKAPKREDESLNIMLIDSKVFQVRISLDAPYVKVADNPFYLKDPRSNSSQVGVLNVFHCDGLLLCTTKDKRLMVWNPCSGKPHGLNLETSTGIRLLCSRLHLRQQIILQAIQNLEGGSSRCTTH